jgi:LCP family protein required for cell wall assembly
MQYNNFNDDSIDLYSASYEDISSHSRKTKKKKRKGKGKGIATLLIILVVVAAIAVGGYSYAYSIINKVERTPLETEKPEELNITTSEYDGIKNIALLGIDTRQDNTSGRSDAVLVLSVDKKHNKIKLISIARDSYVAIDGHRNDKLTHAYAYGKSTLAVKTLNKNFGLEISDYVTVNFHGFSRIIDYIGGVEIDVNKKEMDHLNSYIIPKLIKSGFDCERIKSTGKQRLSGTQALCYSRIRKIDGDVERGNRQKEVLGAMFDEVKGMNVSKLPKVAEMVFSECQTSLSTKDIISMGLWAVTSSPTMENISIPNDNVKGKGQMMNGGWYYVYDIKAAAKEMKDFILETGKTEETETDSSSN